MKYTTYCFSLLIFNCVIVCAQSKHSENVKTNTVSAAKDSLPVVMATGMQYKAGAWKSFRWGQHYRKEWTTPVGFPVLNLTGFEGGLTPIKSGGGHQSKSLRLMAGNGKEYVLRTIDKSLDMIVPSEFKGTFINDIVNDQISTAHPYGPIAISHLAGSVSLMHTNPKIYYVPDDPALGEFRNIFANKLCLLEERPSGKGWANDSTFGNADEIVNTEKMLEKTFDNSANSVDQRAYLKVRLFDMIINDWDRHEDQWIWASKKTGDQRIYTPIARDRDQAFSKTDGVYMYLLSRRYALRPLQSMNSHIRDLRGENFAARNLDRQFLNQLTRDDWKQTIRYVQTGMTDSSIKSAINAMPNEVNKISGDFLFDRLTQRRDNIMRDGMRYYSIENKDVYINGSDKDEHFDINSLNKDSVEIAGYRPGEDTFYHRVFDKNDTRAINIYGLGGDDQFKVNANAKNHFKIRLVGGEGNDSYVGGDQTAKGKRYRTYDSLYTENPERKIFKANNSWDTIYNYRRASVKNDWYIPLVVPGYNPDDEFFIAAGLLYKKQLWGKTPFGWQQSLQVTYATGTGAIGFRYKGLFKQVIGKWDLDLAAHYQGPRYTFNYYGLGNETELNGYNKSYFRVKGNDLYVSPGISRTWGAHSLRFGLQYENTEILKSQDKFATSPESRLDSSVFASINYGGASLQWMFSKVDDNKYRTKGVEMQSGISFLNNLDNNERRFLNLTGSVSLYHTFFNRLTLAHRTGAAKLFGDYEFYQANVLGGDQNLRGYWRSRFAGKSSFYQNTELRLGIGDLKGHFMRGKFGVFAFLDDGRVWVENDNSSKLHTGYGGGIFLSPFNLGTMTLYYSSSEEKSMLTLRAGFFF